MSITPDLNFQKSLKFNLAWRLLVIGLTLSFWDANFVISMITAPAQPANSFRITLELTSRNRIDSILLDQLKRQTQNLELSKISRTALKKLFKEKRIQIKGQNAVPSSMLAVGVTYVDILGFSAQSAS